LIAALEAASSERVIVLTADFSPRQPDLILALTAWPEQEAVMPGDASLDHPYCAIYLRDRVLGIAREQAAKGELSLEVLHARIETARVSFAALGLDDFGSQGPMGVEVSHRLAQVEDC
jgi:molybdopterin-guanine dinucleotide biosynthesis protein A